MAVRTPAHHTTSHAVAQTLEIYDRDARLFLTRWGKPRYKRPALLVEWRTLLPARAVLLDPGCGVVDASAEGDGDGRPAQIAWPGTTGRSAGRDGHVRNQKPDSAAGMDSGAVRCPLEKI
ncbi:MAG TPA: hypothetical protein VLE03_06700 [Nitrospiraceae bacterium]|nr:hypothetical protein [Nitrospiraceae bacterium]